VPGAPRERPDWTVEALLDKELVAQNSPESLPNAKTASESSSDADWNLNVFGCGDGFEPATFGLSIGGKRLILNKINNLTRQNPADSATLAQLVLCK
jgi:hypothetical protein